MRPDQRQAALSRAGSGPAPQTNVFAFVIIVGPKGQLLVYSPTAGSGNLIASISGATGTDSYGNQYLQGITTYLNVGGGVFDAVNLNGNDLNFEQSTTGAGGPYSVSQTFVSGTSSVISGLSALNLVGNLSTASNLIAGTLVYTPGVKPLISSVIETVHQITAGFPAGWSGTISYWQTADGVSTRCTIDYHLTIANTTVVTNNEALGVSLASGYFYPTDNKFVFGQINGGGLAGNQFAPLRIDNAGGLHYSGPGFTATSSAFWYGGHTYAIAV